MQLTLIQLIHCGATAKGADRYLHALNTYGPKLGLSTPKRWAFFLAQVLHESLRMSRVSENLNYSAEAIVNTWPKRFTFGQAKNYERKPQTLANLVYANRMGNGPEQTGEGWKYRGRGLIQITGKDNYLAFGRWLQKMAKRFPGLLPVLPSAEAIVENPELLEEPVFAVLSALWFFEDRGLHELSDIGHFMAQTRVINGGLNGYNDRELLVTNCLKVLV